MGAAAPERAVKEVARGDVRTTARRWLGPLTVITTALFVVDTLMVASQGLLFFDLPVALFVQRVPWGPFVYAMDATNVVAGYWEVLAGALIVLAMVLVDRRAGWLMAIGSIASVFDNVLKLLFERHRPTADLVQVLTPASGYSYPSGHAVFYTWLGFMLAFAVVPKLAPRLRPLVWAAAGLLIFTACTGRIWAGDHWPSDVLGGFLFALAWSAFVLWLPERWLPNPNRRWVGIRG